MRPQPPHRHRLGLHPRRRRAPEVPAKEIQALINRNLTLRFTPHLRFRLDVGIAKGDRVLDILSHLPPPADDPADDGAPAEPAP